MDSRWIGMGVPCLMILTWLALCILHNEQMPMMVVVLVALVQIAVGYRLGQYVNRLRQMAYYDSLTGVLVNRRFLDRLIREINQAKNQQYPLTLLFIDLDNFKQFNDSHGHMAGDRLLCQFASILQANVQSQDTVGRWGGEEFVVLLKHTDTNEALAVGKRIQEQVRHALSGVTVSIGAASYPMHADTAEELTHKADTLMYEAKKKKDCMIVATY